MTSNRTFLAGLIALACGAILPADAGAQTVETRPVTIALAEGYPAFDPAVSERHPRAKPLAALAVQQYLPDRPVSVILLNPAHADVQTLARAVRALARCPAAAPSGTPTSGWIVISPRPEAAAAQPQDADRLAAWLDELRAQPVTNLRHVGAEAGRAITVQGLEVCIPPAGQQRRRFAPPAPAPEAPGHDG